MQGISTISAIKKSTYKKNRWPAPVQFGTLLSESFSSLSNWAQTGGGTFTPGGSGLTISGGTGSFINDYITYTPLPNSIEKWIITVSLHNISLGSFVCGISSLQINSSLNRSFFTQLGVATGNYDSRIVTFNDGTGVTATVKNNSATSPISAGDDFTIVFERNFDVYTSTITNVTKGTSQVSTWTVDRSTVAVPNVSGRFVIFAGAGSWRVNNFTVTSASYKNPKALFVGDSITHGANISTSALRYSKYSFGSAITEVNAGGNHRVTDIYQQLSTIQLFNPQYFFMMIGKNNIRDGQVFADFQSDYTAIRDTAAALGATVVHYTPTPENALDMSGLRSSIISTFTSDIVIDAYTYAKGSGTAMSSTWNTGLADGIHPNEAFNAYLSKITVASIPDLLRGN